MSGYGRLDRGRILDAALRIAARPGVSEITFRELGAELGADPTAVYRHFDSKQQIVEAAIDRLMGEVADAIDVDAAWRDTLLGAASRLLETFTRHPALGRQLTDVRAVGPAELLFIERTLATLERAGLGGEELVRHFAALSGFAIAFIAGACRELLAAGDGEVSGADDLAWLPEAAATEHPMFARYGTAIAALDFRSTYDTTIELIVDSIGDAAT